MGTEKSKGEEKNLTKLTQIQKQINSMANKFVAVFLMCIVVIAAFDNAAASECYDDCYSRCKARSADNSNIFCEDVTDIHQRRANEREHKVLLKGIKGDGSWNKLS